MLRQAVLTFAVVGALSALSLPDSLAAQTCNHCGEPPECHLWKHWDNCGFSGWGVNWYGFCTSGGCKPLDCSAHWGSPCGSDPFDHPAQFASTSGTADSGEPIPRWAIRAAEQILERSVRDLGLPHQFVWDPDEAVLLLLECDGSTIQARIPVGDRPVRPNLKAVRWRLVTPRPLAG